MPQISYDNFLSHPVVIPIETPVDHLMITCWRTGHVRFKFAREGVTSGEIMLNPMQSLDMLCHVTAKRDWASAPRTELGIRFYWDRGEMFISMGQNPCRDVLSLVGHVLLEEPVASGVIVDIMTYTNPVRMLAS